MMLVLFARQGRIRAMAVRVLREILRYQPERFRDYAELTILKVLEAHKVRACVCVLCVCVCVSLCVTAGQPCFCRINHG